MRERNRERKSGETVSPLIFCGDAFASRGKLWSPYSTDWDHWTDAGFEAGADSLRKLAELRTRRLCPEHGPVLVIMSKNVEDGGDSFVVVEMRAAD